MIVLNARNGNNNDRQHGVPCLVGRVCVFAGGAHFVLEVKDMRVVFLCVVANVLHTPRAEANIGRANHSVDSGNNIYNINAALHADLLPHSG